MTQSATAEAVDPIALAAREGLLCAHKWLSPWLFYDETGSQLFEQITTLPEYYLTRTERVLLERYAPEILQRIAPVTIVELGAGTATKTGILLRCAADKQGDVLYEPIDVSSSALEEARENIEQHIPGVRVRAQIANYITESIRIDREPGRTVLALYIGSSIGNFSPAEARGILANLRAQLRPGDHLLLGTDLAPGAHKSVASLLSAYDDAAGVTAAFNLNILARLNRDLGADFKLDCFTHQARWNGAHSRVEMHLASTVAQTVHVPANSSGAAFTLHFTPGETIHTENSYKFTLDAVAALLNPAGFAPAATFNDPADLYALTLAEAT